MSQRQEMPRDASNRRRGLFSLRVRVVGCREVHKQTSGFPLSGPVALTWLRDVRVLLWSPSQAATGG